MLESNKKYFGATGIGFYSFPFLSSVRLKDGKTKDVLESVPAQKCRSLLALDGEFLPPSLLTEAQANCLQFADRVDILMVNPPKTPTTVLCGLLLKLEQAGVDYRLTFASGKLGEQITRYLKRFLGIQLVIMRAPRDLAGMASAEFAGLWDRRIRFVPLGGMAAA